MNDDYSKQILTMIEHFDVISFDIFDTLLKRDIEKPQDIFRVVQKEYNQSNKDMIILFPERRNIAARMAYRFSDEEEISLDKIYEYLFCPEKKRSILKQLELETEYKLAVRNKPIFDIVKHCREAGKKVYAISDMYLDQDFIERLLKKCGYEMDGIFVSSKYQVTKASGKLFKFFLAEVDIPADRILHIGDSQVGDIDGALLAGIRSFKIPNRISNTNYHLTKRHRTPLERSMLQAFINNRMTANGNRFEQIGYEVLGPFLYGFCTWLHENALKYKIRKIFFFARDTKLTMEIYKEIYGEDAVSSEYFYASRRSLLTPYYYSTSKLTDIEAKLQYEAFHEYARQIGLLEPGNIAAVDDGGYCRPQFMLKELLKSCSAESKYHSFNFELAKGYKKYLDDENCLSYLFKGKTSPTKMIVSNGLFEAMISAAHGSTYKYERTSNGVQPILGPVYGLPVDIEEMQSGALRFAHDWNNSPFRHTSFSPDHLIEPFFNIALNPRANDVELLGNMKKCEDLDSTFIIYKGATYYRSHFKQWLSDFQNSHWKGGFLKKNFKST